MDHYRGGSPLLQVSSQCRLNYILTGGLVYGVWHMSPCLMGSIPQHICTVNASHVLRALLAVYLPTSDCMCWCNHSFPSGQSYEGSRPSFHHSVSFFVGCCLPATHVNMNGSLTFEDFFPLLPLFIQNKQLFENATKFIPYTKTCRTPCRWKNFQHMPW